MCAQPQRPHCAVSDLAPSLQGVSRQSTPAVSSQRQQGCWAINHAPGSAVQRRLVRLVPSISGIPALVLRGPACPLRHVGILPTSHIPQHGPTPKLGRLQTGNMARVEVPRRPEMPQDAVVRFVIPLAARLSALVLSWSRRSGNKLCGSWSTLRLELPAARLLLVPHPIPPPLPNFSRPYQCRRPAFPHLTHTPTFLHLSPLLATLPFLFHRCAHLPARPAHAIADFHADVGYTGTSKRRPEFLLRFVLALGTLLKWLARPRMLKLGPFSPLLLPS